MAAAPFSAMVHHDHVRLVRCPSRVDAAPYLRPAAAGTGLGVAAAVSGGRAEERKRLKDAVAADVELIGLGTV